MNTYEEIIDNNRNLMPKNRVWWTKYAFHFTDISNAVNVLLSGFLLSRNRCERNSLMRNDNASRQVIDLTNESVKNYVRFYFRPLTPTQYNNEGFKHPDLRLQDANVPVPIFFLFDLKTLMQNNLTHFSELSQAGMHGSHILSGVDNFKNLDFAKIYADGPMDSNEEIKYRQAEILYPEKYPINDSLVSIICRNEVERRYLINLLKDKDLTIYMKYRSKIKICRENLFYSNGLCIQDIKLKNSTLEFTFNNARKRYMFASRRSSKNDVDIDNLPLLNGEIQLKWKDRRGRYIDAKLWTMCLDYLYIDTLFINLASEYDSAYMLEIIFSIENIVMCDIDYPLNKESIF